ncbi:cytochrome p450 domain-containing protein [Sarocladium implicatum]|nr:cytochrome p450 domain-containing protein [Sarocladium implicatum]
MTFVRFMTDLSFARTTVLGIIVLVAYVLLSMGLNGVMRFKGPLPPGPPGEFLLGHLRIIPTFSPEYAFIKWSKHYGSDILSFNVLGQPVIVLNSVQAAVDLLDKRGANYCDRPRFVLFEVMGWGKTLTFLRWGPTFRKHRRILQKSFQKSNIVPFRPLQERETVIMLHGIASNPGQWDSIIRRFATAVVLGIGFGLKISGNDDHFIDVARDASYALGHGGAPAGTPVDFFPFLRWLPSAFHDRSLKFARDWRWAIVNLHDKPFEAVIKSDERAHSLINSLLDQRKSQIEKGADAEMSLDDIKGAAGAVYAAGQDTTWATLIVFILNMVLHPNIQLKAQKVLDEVVGRNRLPTFEDRPRLRYIDYIVQETLRWCPVSPVGVPHRSLADDTYSGYFIPAGSYVYANARAMTHDERTYQDPDEFDPDRFTPKAGGGRGEPFPAGQFGFGRRICVGQHLAEASVWIVVAGMLSTMNILKAVDGEGKEITPDVELTAGLTSHPKSFRCRIVPRDGEAQAAIQIAIDSMPP